jgi:conjugative transfer signal peptidase TraF
MMLSFRKITTLSAVASIGLIFIGVGLYSSGLKLNTTKSIPLGIYYETSNDIERGSYVLFCPTSSPAFKLAKQRDYIGAGFCPGDYGYMMKMVAAKSGDIVSVDERGVFVNGKLLPFSKPFKADGHGDVLPEFRVTSYTLKDDELLLMTDINPRSFDARYFGLLKSSNVQSAIEPVFTW